MSVLTPLSDRVTLSAGITVDKYGVIFFVDGTMIRRIDQNGIISTLLGFNDLTSARPLSCDAVMDISQVALWPAARRVASCLSANTALLDWPWSPAHESFCLCRWKLSAGGSSSSQFRVLFCLSAPWGQFFRFTALAKETEEESKSLQAFSRLLGFCLQFSNWIPFPVFT